MTIVILFAVCVSILAIGKYNALDSMIKVIAITLLVSTTSAFLLVLSNGPIEPVPGFEPKVLWTSSGFFFLLALIGSCQPLWIYQLEQPLDTGAYKAVKIRAKARGDPLNSAGISDNHSHGSDVCDTRSVPLLWLRTRASTTTHFLHTM